MKRVCNSSSSSSSSNISNRKSLALKILVSAADYASSAGFWAHFNIVTYLLTTYLVVVVVIDVYSLFLLLLYLLKKLSHCFSVITLNVCSLGKTKHLDFDSRHYKVVCVQTSGEVDGFQPRR